MDYQQEFLQMFGDRENTFVKKDNCKETGIILVLSKYRSGSSVEEYVVEGEEQRCYKGFQTNDAPIQYLIDEVYNAGDNLKKIICIATPEVEKSKEGEVNTLERFIYLVKEYTKITWGAEDVEVDCISYSTGYEEEKKYYNFYKDLNDKTSDLQACYVDYTGGLRDTSFLMVVAIRFLEFKGIKCQKVVYSDYYSTPKVIRNLNEIYGLFQMINGMNEFISSGTTRQLDDLFDSENNLVVSIRRFSNATNVGDVENLDEYIHKLSLALDKESSDGRLKSLMVDSMKNVINRKLFGLSEEKKLINQKGDIDYYRLIEWCIDNKMFQQAAVLYIEKVPVVYWRDGIISDLVGLSEVVNNGSSRECDTFYRVLPEWMVSNQNEIEIKDRLSKVEIPNFLEWDCIKFLNDLKKSLKGYDVVYNRLEAIIYATYRNYKKDSKNIRKIYGNEINTNDVKKFMNMMQEKKYIHYLLYNNKDAYERINSTDKVRSFQQIKLIYDNACNGGKTNDDNACNGGKTNDDKSISKMLAFYLAIKMLRNKMSHAIETTDQEMEKVIIDLEKFLVQVGYNVKITLDEKDVCNLLSEAITFTKSLTKFVKK